MKALAGPRPSTLVGSGWPRSHGCDGGRFGSCMPASTPKIGGASSVGPGAAGSAAQAGCACSGSGVSNSGARDSCPKGAGAHGSCSCGSGAYDGGGACDC
jgi:hypothetical protein